MLITLDESHRKLVHQVRDEAGEWLATKGTDQYRGGLDMAQVHANIDHDFDRFPFAGWEIDGRVVAMLALIDPEADFWTQEELAEPQTYISRFFVVEHGKGYGSALLQAVVEQAKRDGKRWIRLNCWSTNTRLHSYYLAHGFEHVRTCNVAGRPSGACFQRRLDMSSNDELRAKILAKLDKAGYPLEMRVAARMRESGAFYVSLSQNYIDPTTSKVRETDILANWLDTETQAATTYFYLVVECKSKPQPWVVFDDGLRYTSEDPEDNLILTPKLIAGDDTNRLLLESLITFDESYPQVATLFTPTEIGMSSAIVEVSLRDGANPNETNKAWAAVQSAASAALGLLQGSRKFLDVVSRREKNVAILYVPIVVTSGKLFRSWLNEDNEMDLAEIERAEVAVRLAPELPHTRCIVVTEAGLTSLLGQVAPTRKALKMILDDEESSTGSPSA